jgi:non-specific serine/threonine protein kinase/serine/threonine-protein kinase
LRRRLEGDLDNIVLKAMAKAPSRRYASADEFAADIRRHLAGRPVAARPDTLFYRASKFVRRNRTGVAAVAMVLVALVGGLVGIAWQARIARAERARAEARFNDVRSLAQAFIFEMHDAIAPLPGSTSARSLLVRRALEYLDRLSAEPEAPVDLTRELAAGYERLGDVQGRRLAANLGDTSGALASQRKALALRERLLARDPADPHRHAEVGTSHARIGELLLVQAGMGEATRSYRRAVAALERARELGDASPATIRELSSAYDRLGSAIASGGNIQEALGFFRRSNETLEPLAAASPDDIELQRSMAVGYHRLGNALGNPNHPNVGDTDGAFQQLGRARDILARLHARHPDHAIVRRSLAVVLGNLGDVRVGRKEYAAGLAANREAQAHFEALARADRANMTARRDVALGFWKLAQLESEVGSRDEALRLAEAAKQEFETLARLDPDNGVAQSDLAVAYSLLGDLWLRRGRPAEALALFRRMLLVQDALTQADAANAEMQYALATAYGQLGQASAAVAATERGAAARARQEEACGWYARARQGFAALHEKGVLTGTDATRLDQADRELTACRQTLARM